MGSIPSSPLSLCYMRVEPHLSIAMFVIAMSYMKMRVIHSTPLMRIVVGDVPGTFQSPVYVNSHRTRARDTLTPYPYGFRESGSHTIDSNSWMLRRATPYTTPDHASLSWLPIPNLLSHLVSPLSPSPHCSSHPLHDPSTCFVMSTFSHPIGWSTTLPNNHQIN